MSATDPSLDERVVLVAQALSGANLPFAFGGALALAYYAEPRATIDIDVNVFVGVEKVARLLAVLGPLDIKVDGDVSRKLRDEGQGRLRWDRYLLDVFLSTHRFHEMCADRIRRVPFGDREIPILSAEDLLIFKLLFDRPKDWIDIEQILFAQAGEFDIGYVDLWLAELIDDGDPRRSRFDQAIRNVTGGA